jgi:hypothetical protein
LAALRAAILERSFRELVPQDPAAAAEALLARTRTERAAAGHEQPPELHENDEWLDFRCLFVIGR